MTSRSSKLAYLAAGLGVASLAGVAYGVLRSRAVEARHPPKGQRIGSAGSRIHYVQQGSGPDLLLIHGAAMTLDEMVAGPMATLAEHFRVTAVDRPGHGYSDPDPGRSSAVGQANRLHATVLALGLDRPVVVGHSLGGAVALAYGARFPEETSGVVAIAPLAYPGWGPGHASPALHAAPGIGAALSHSLFALVDPTVMKLSPLLIFSPQKPTDAFRRDMPMGLSGRPRSVRADGADVVSTSAGLHGLSRTYADYPVPVHVLVGGKDRILKPARQGERLARALPDVRLTVEPDLGHMLHHFVPEAVLAAAQDVRRRSSAAGLVQNAAAR